MSIIKRQALKNNNDKNPSDIGRPNSIIKSSFLKPIEHTVSPHQFTNDIIYDESSIDAEPTPTDFLSEPSPENDPFPQPTQEDSNVKETAEDLSNYINDLLSAINGLKTARDELIKSSESQIVDLSLAIAEKIVQKKIELDPTIIKTVVEDSFNKISGSDRITFKINPSDAEIFSEFQPTIESRLIGVEKITIQQDATIEQGGCIIETDLGFVDITIKEKLNIIAQTLHKIKSSR